MDERWLEDMYTPWSNASLKRAIQITKNLSKICECLQTQVPLSRPQILQARRELDELKARDEVPGAIAMYHKYAALLNPYLHACELDSYPSLAGDQQVTG